MIEEPFGLRAGALPGVAGSPLFFPLRCMMPSTEKEKKRAVIMNAQIAKRVVIPMIVMFRDSCSRAYPPSKKSAQYSPTAILVVSIGLARLRSRCSFSGDGCRSIITPTLSKAALAATEKSVRMPRTKIRISFNVPPVC